MHYYLFSLLLLLSTVLSLSCGRENHGNSETQATYLLAASDLPAYEQTIDHKGLIANEINWTEDWGMRNRATAIYRTHCYSCHGNQEQPGSLPNSKKFWQDTLKNGADPYSMYQTITRGFGQMPPHPQLVPRQKYEVIAFIREEFMKPHNPSQYVEVDTDYLDRLPKGPDKGPDPSPYHPWSEMNYGNWLIRCYEMADSSAPPKHISGGRAPLANEDYSEVNFAYKGIAVRLDEGEGGIAAGNTFALFDHDLMRFVGAWQGEGFIDWEDILLDDQHNVYPRTVGKQIFANPITPGWANPETGSFDDPREKGLDGRPFGPLPRSWTHYKGLYRYGDKVVISYTVDRSKVLESYDMSVVDGRKIIIRHIRIDRNDRELKLRIAPDSMSASVKGINQEIRRENGFLTLQLPPGENRQFSVFAGALPQQELDRITSESPSTPNLLDFTRGGPALYPETLTSPIIPGNDNDPYAVDVMVLPQENPWKSRMRPTGIDFMDNGEVAVVSTIDGEVWRVEGITRKTGELSWKRIATGMFQPLGIKVHEGKIYVSCRDQIVILRDLNGDGETDFYESFNSDHQVTEHFHEFAMGLQTDDEGNFYYAKSGRHARTSLVPQHGTLIKVSADGETSEILARGFRAANGVCINPDGSFYVTDQQGFWNPMNRINRVTKSGFYGNMWGYGSPADSSDEAMIQPMCWIDMKYDRSPSELVWAESDQWGPLSGSLLNLSYGYGKVFVVMPQKVGDMEQGGMVEMPVPQFPTGIMRARFNPKDGQFYGCGMAAWATSRMIQVGGLYRIRYTGKPLNSPVELKAMKEGMKIIFSQPLDKAIAMNPESFEINTWDIKRTRAYGSKRFNTKTLDISEITLSEDGKTVFIHLPEIQSTWIMEILYDLKSRDGASFSGAIQNSVYQLEEEV